MGSDSYGSAASRNDRNLTHMLEPTESQALDHFHRKGAALADRRSIHAPGIAIDSHDLVYLSALPDLKQLVLTGSAIMDACLSVIATLRQLEILDISDNSITDDGAKNLAGLTNLRVLGLYRTQVSDATATILAELHSLEMLNISFTSMTDRGLLQLVHLSHIHAIEVHHTKITSSGIRRFLQNHPAAMLVTDDGVVRGGVA